MNNIRTKKAFKFVRPEGGRKPDSRETNSFFCVRTPLLATLHRGERILFIALLLSTPILYPLAPNKAPLAKAAHNSVLLDAARKDMIERTRSMLAGGSNPDSMNSNGVTPLMLAAYNGHIAIAKLLLTHKAQVNLTTQANIDFNFGKLLSNKNNKTTALMLAAFSGKLEIVIALLRSGADVNAQDSDGQTALIYAILGDANWPHSPLNSTRKKIVQALLDHGADASITDKNGLDAAYYYSCVAGLVPGFGGKYDNDPAIAEEDPIYSRMK